MNTDKLIYFYIKNIKKSMFCPACKNGKMTYNKRTTQWTCGDCQYSFSEEYFLDDCVFWFCDECQTFLNNQVGFDRYARKHVCCKCGYTNDTSFSNIRGYCSDCGHVISNPDATLCDSCRKARRTKAKEWLITAGQVAAGVAIVAGTVILAVAKVASSVSDSDETNYSYLPDYGDDPDGATTLYIHLTDDWIRNAPVTALRSASDQLGHAMENMDPDSSEYVQLELKRFEVDNAILRRF